MNNEHQHHSDNNKEIMPSLILKVWALENIYRLLTFNCAYGNQFLIPIPDTRTQNHNIELATNTRTTPRPIEEKKRINITLNNASKYWVLY